jgi:hypothetical protein
VAGTAKARGRRQACQLLNHLCKFSQEEGRGDSARLACFRGRGADVCHLQDERNGAIRVMETFVQTVGVMMAVKSLACLPPQPTPWLDRGGRALIAALIAQDADPVPPAQPTELLASLLPTALAACLRRLQPRTRLGFQHAAIPLVQGQPPQRVARRYCSRVQVAPNVIITAENRRELCTQSRARGTCGHSAAQRKQGNHTHHGR